MVTALLVVPVALRVELAAARHQRDRAEQAARRAQRAERAEREVLANGAATLAAHQERAEVAATAVEAARARLAEAGVSEKALREVLNETKGKVAGVEAQSRGLSKDLDRQAAQLPAAMGCVDEVVRVVGRAAQAASTGDDSPGLSADCVALGRAVLDESKR
ncbi:hypothetical protein KSP35_12895 [Aquihabitans sp. G128]|uniref:hypothetical protein n=1 Tax=Aquihabitans sp. G128 TaxID=2849779 RepID=UPI001C2426A5|nr:hypothetical protein [Aquihabitans sp. G128]QXC59302.1 hypothetical protein KSP35_12895 [Aquihabitans sp. G128]